MLPRQCQDAAGWQTCQRFSWGPSHAAPQRNTPGYTCLAVDHAAEPPWRASISDDGRTPSSSLGKLENRSLSEASLTVGVGEAVWGSSSTARGPLTTYGLGLRASGRSKGAQDIFEVIEQVRFVVWKFARLNMSPAFSNVGRIPRPGPVRSETGLQVSGFSVPSHETGATCCSRFLSNLESCVSRLLLWPLSGE